MARVCVIVGHVELPSNMARVCVIVGHVEVQVQVHSTYVFIRASMDVECSSLKGNRCTKVHVCPVICMIVTN